MNGLKPYLFPVNLAKLSRLELSEILNGIWRRSNSPLAYRQWTMQQGYFPSTAIVPVTAREHLNAIAFSMKIEDFNLFYSIGKLDSFSEKHFCFSSILNMRTASKDFLKKILADLRIQAQSEGISEPMIFEVWLQQYPGISYNWKKASHDQLLEKVATICNAPTDISIYFFMEKPSDYIQPSLFENSTLEL